MFLVRQDWRSPMDAVFSDLLNQSTTRRESPWAPHYEVSENEQTWSVTMDVPGVSTEDLVVEVKGTELKVSGERKFGSFHSARRINKFEQIFTLPEGVREQNISAKLRDGVLTLQISKPEEIKPLRIQVTEGTSN